MTFSCPSFLASATSALMPPQAAAEVAVAQFVELAAPPLLLAELPDAAAELLEELELLQPAASRIDPTAATDATIAFDARKVKPSPCRPWSTGANVGILARQVASWLSRLNGRLRRGSRQPSVSSRFMPPFLACPAPAGARGGSTKSLARDQRANRPAALSWQTARSHAAPRPARSRDSSASG